MDSQQLTTLITFVREIGTPTAALIAMFILLFKVIDAFKEWGKNSAAGLKQQNELITRIATENTGAINRHSEAVDRLIQRLDETSAADTVRDKKTIETLETLTGTILQVDSRIGSNTSTLEAVKGIAESTKAAVDESIPALNNSLDTHIKQLSEALKAVESSLGDRIDLRADDTQTKIARTIVETVEPVAKVLDSAKAELENLRKVTNSVNDGVGVMRELSGTLTERLGGTIDTLTQWVISMSKPPAAATAPAIKNGDKTNVSTDAI